MKGYTRAELEASRPTVDAEEAVELALERLYEDDRHDMEDEVVKDLTFEELLGALLLARDVIKDSLP